ncbi:MAG: hypothetical protein ABI639_16065 [Thermoanaerobaculia bacterium]
MKATSRPPSSASSAIPASARRPLLLLAIWLVVGEILIPALISWLYRADLAGGPMALVHAVESARMHHTLAEALASWRNNARWIVVAVVGYQLIAAASRSPRFAERFVPPATPGMLGAIRAWVATVLLISALWENLASTALLPRGMVNIEGIFRLLYALPIGFAKLVASANALGVFQTFTVLLLVAAAVGYRTRWTVPLAASAYLVMAGIFRQYAWFYHSGLVPMFLLFVLSFTPCGDGFSIDRWLRSRRGLPVPEAARATLAYGWARFLLWTTLALPYVEAGLSKLRRGGLGWADPANLKSVLLVDTLNPMQFDWGVTLHLLHAPDALFWAIGVGTILGETGFGLVLFSRRARQLMPLVTIGMHFGIWLLQNVLFFDLILLQAILYDWRPVGQWIANRFPVLRAPGSPGVPPATATWGRALPSASVPVDWARRLRILAAVFITCWGIRVEEFPLTAMQMYSKPDTTGIIEWIAVRATFASGETRKAPIEAAIPAMRDARYRRVVRRGFLPENQMLAKTFLADFAAAHNAKAPAAERITAVAVERWRWDWAKQPDDPRHGELAASYGISVAR